MSSARGRRGRNSLLLLCGCAVLVGFAGCRRSNPPAAATDAAREAQQRLTPVWALLERPDLDALRRAARALADVPSELLDSAVYGVEGDPALLDFLRIGDVTVRADGQWIEAAALSFRELVQSLPPGEARRAYDALDGLFAGVMRSARNWTARRAGSNVAPLAYHSVVDLRALLARVLLESDATAGDPAFRAAIAKRRERLHAIRREFARISAEVP